MSERQEHRQRLKLELLTPPLLSGGRRISRHAFGSSLSDAG
jgi:hypothetical protein